MEKSEYFSITQTTKGKLPRLPFEEMKNEILGKKYEISLVFIGDTTSKKLNFKYRGKDKPANILSFPLSKNEGEIFINLNKAKKDAKKFDSTPSKFIGFLFIHGLLHLKGYSHSSTMESMEQTLRGKFNV